MIDPTALVETDSGFVAFAYLTDEQFEAFVAEHPDDGWRVARFWAKECAKLSDDNYRIGNWLRLLVEAVDDHARSYERLLVWRKNAQKFLTL